MPPSTHNIVICNSSCQCLISDSNIQVYPLFATTGVAVGICVMQLVRNITTNPEVRVTKQNRAAGVLENHDEGKRYSQHGVRRFWLSKRPDYMHELDNPPTDRK
ncbi:unnamed protein product [Triticum turgidum subsp. durum]|uniref:Uncharacterized protein n=1 Tax=Triticum turgidum subsp. durum TaxID=4567 RepID=A0A9R0XK55_TRITD|nr:unnamed protein product [Triticum turgidum subsp. durum]